MTYGVVLERLGLTRDQFDRLPWHDARMYVEYLRDTEPGGRLRDPQDRAAGGYVDEVDEPRHLESVPDYVPGPDEVLDVGDYDPADDDTPPAPPPPIVLPTVVPDAVERERAEWMPALPITRVERFGD